MLTLIKELMLSMTVIEDSSQGGVLFCCVPNPTIYEVLPERHVYNSVSCSPRKIVVCPPYIVSYSHRLDREIERDPPDP